MPDFNRQCGERLIRAWPDTYRVLHTGAEEDGTEELGGSGAGSGHWVVGPARSIASHLRTQV
ncbi:hypothetical protein SAMN04487917_11371 [Arthrobacter sp. yr096]|uniref:hypothetical protein n=1 Tax=Arthrobacter sp. yr096 TaxID=1761750 RepID=UPI0008D60BC5|nr:hypothetical protein [Arthrobacter sp. yr096]SEJ78275.1 hypothetical protein SAMN04487917_11371 [Arthrobacter sp. yr096]